MNIYRLMKRNYKLLALGLVFAFASCSFTTKNFENDNKDKLLIDLISYVLGKTHFDAKDVNDDFSQSVFEEYIDGIDPLKRYFLASDIEEFKEYENLIDDQIKELDITFFNVTHQRLTQRMDEAKAFYTELLEKPFNFDEAETISTDYDKLAYAQDKAELKERWRKQLKFSTLSTLLEKQDELKNDKNAEAKSMQDLEAEARELTRTSYEEYFDFNDDLERKDWFSVYVNAIVEEFDPHTYYFAPSDKDRFDIQMSGKLEGIGARLQRKNDNIKIVEIISGGPVWRDERIEVGDLILKVKQEDEKEPLSIVGMRLDDAITFIKGPKGTKVTLTVKKVDGTLKDITLVRDVVELEETYAKSATVEKDDRRFGVINLPKFYFDMQNYKERNAAKDVKEEIIRLKKEGMEGLVLDLRNNGGGSLQTVVDIAGLFIEEGPVVQVKTKEAGREVLKDRDKNVIWDGPLVILVNELSASASEILAAAMQDYKRAIIIGSKQTYGKGTVQNVMDLNRWLRQNEYGDMGALKVTTQKFYRVNGGSTQLEGVKSDVVVPDRYSFIDIGEKDLENPLPWDKIESADYTPWDGYIDYETTISNSKARMAENSQLKLIEENARWIRAQRDDNEFSLNYSEYKAEVDKDKTEAKKYDALDDYKTNLTYNSLPYEMALFENDTILEEKRNRWHKSLAKDVYMEEAINVLEDLKLNNIRRNKVANIKN